MTKPKLRSIRPPTGAPEVDDVLLADPLPQVRTDQAFLPPRRHHVRELSQALGLDVDHRADLPMLDGARFALVVSYTGQINIAVIGADIQGGELAIAFHRRSQIRKLAAWLAAVAEAHDDDPPAVIAARALQ